MVPVAEQDGQRRMGKLLEILLDEIKPLLAPEKFKKAGRIFRCLVNRFELEKNDLNASRF